MAQTYDPLVLRLWLLEGTPAVKVYYREGSVKMRKVRKRPEGGAKLNEYWDSRVADALHRDGELLVSLREGDYFLTPTVAMKPLQKGKLVHLLTTKTETIGVYTFGDLLTSDRPGLAKALFGDITSYTIGQALLWDVAQQKAQKLPRRKKISCEEFHPEDFSAIGPHYIYKRGACGMAFFHQDLGFFKGLKDLKEEFPTATTTEVRELYSSFGYTPSSSIAKVFKPSPKKEKKERYSDYHEGEVESSEERSSLEDLIRKYNIHTSADGKSIYYDDPVTGSKVGASSKANLYKLMQESGISIDHDDFATLWTRHRRGELGEEW